MCGEEGKGRSLRGEKDETFLTGKKTKLKGWESLQK